VQGVTDPTVVGEGVRDVEAGLPGSEDVPPFFFVLDGLLIVKECLASVARPIVNYAQLMLSVCALRGRPPGSGPGIAGSGGERR
jgi:hypothetical protein